MPLTKQIISKLKIEEPDLIVLMNRIIDKFKANGIEHLILGCTELPLFVKYNREKLHEIVFIDTMEVLAKNIVNT
jgi:aspartate/glutamate racemase